MNRNHSEIEEWTVTKDFKTVWTGIKQAVEKLDSDYTIIAANEEKKFMRIGVLTPKAKWLDTVDITFLETEKREVVIESQEGKEKSTEERAKTSSSEEKVVLNL